MKFQELMASNPEVASKLVEEGEYVCMLSADPSLHGPEKVTDSIRFAAASPVAKKYRDAKGYVGCGAVTWFEFCTKNMPNEEALRFAANAVVKVSGEV